MSINPGAAQSEVNSYYTATTDDYLRYYDTDWHQHMHYGFDRDLPKGGNPTENLVRYMAEVAGISGNERVLDAGCGVGGSLFWLWHKFAIQGTGLNYLHMQCALARGFREKQHNGADVVFVNGDFMSPPFQSESFDVVWAIESSDHAPDKRLWVQKMYELLKPGGRLIVADGFREERDFNPKEQRMYDDFIRGWAVPHLATGAEFSSAFSAAGFRETLREDITADVMPHAFAIWRFGLIFVPWRRFLNKLGLCSQAKVGNAEATLYQYPALKKGLWTYELFCGTK